MDQLTPAELSRRLNDLRKTRQRTCLRCGAPFVTRGRGLYCSSRCRAAAWAKQNREKKRSAKG